MCCAAAGQNQEKPAPGVVAGRILNAKTGEPVRKANVRLYVSRVGTGAVGVVPGPPVTFAATTDAEGKYRIEGVEPGEYRLTAERQGFVTQQYGARRSYQIGTSIQVTSGLELKNLDIRLVPHAVIAGRVLDEEGEPLANAMIQVLQRRYMQGKQQLAGGGGTQTNDMGEFRVAGLAPGRYWLSAMWRSPMSYGGEARNKAAQPQEQYVTTYYPGATDAAAARPIEVSAGQELTGADIRMQKARVYRISGRVEGLDGTARNIQLLVMPRDRFAQPTGPGAGAVVRPDGTFETGGVTPGSYILGLFPMDSRTRNMIGRTVVDVGRENVENVVVPVASTMSLSGSVRIERDPAQPEAVDAAKLDLSKVRVQLMVMEGVPMGVPMATAKDDGTFSIENVAPDRYRVQVFGSPQGTWLKSVRAGDQEVTESGIDLNAGVPGSIDVVLAFGTGTISGTVQDEKQRPAPGSILTLVPDPMKEGRYDLSRMATADQNGRFLLPNIPPGEYKLLAWEDIEPGRAMDPDFLKPFETKAQKVSVRPNGQHQASLTQISAEALEK
jgi:hypothetical protein